MKTFIPTDEDLTTAAFAQAFAEVFGEEEDEADAVDFAWTRSGARARALVREFSSPLLARSGTPTTDEDEDERKAGA